MPKTRLTRGKLLAVTAPLVAAPLVGKAALGADAPPAHHQHPPERMPANHLHGAMGHAAMVGDEAPAVGGPTALDALVHGPGRWVLSSGRIAGPDPWGANTLEWATSSPPPDYNFAVIPTVRSSNPNWDGPTGELVLDDGHQTPATTALDANVDRVLTMPPESPWPFVLALALTLFFTLFLVGHYVSAAISSLLIGGALLGWHAREP